MKRTIWNSSTLTTGALAAALALADCSSPSGQVMAEAPDRAAFEAGAIQFPGATWIEIDSPADWGWSEERLAAAWSHLEEKELDTAAVMVIHRGVLIDSWGEIATRYNGQSMRKALLGAMLGQEVAAGRLDLDATLAELGIDDNSQPLTDQERSARVIDLLQSRTGIYVSSTYEAGGWKRNKPERGSHAPGEAWYYNNWGFNALGTIFESITGTTIDEAFAERVASPIGMEDYRPKDVQYVRRENLTEKIMKNNSEHAAYVFMTSARDMGRFGLLYLNGGRWQNQQVVPSEWVEQTVEDSVATMEFLGGERYGYLWWVDPADSDFGRAIGHASYKSTGGRGHKLIVVPDLDLVIVHRLAVGGTGFVSQLYRRFSNPPSVDDQEFLELMRRIVAAHPEG